MREQFRQHSSNLKKKIAVENEGGKITVQAAGNTRP